MSDNNVLIISYYFPPMGLSGVQRTLKFVKYLPLYGWNPFVLTTTPKVYYAFDETLQQDLEPIQENIYRTAPDISRFLKIKGSGKMKYPSFYGQKIKRIISQTIFQPDSRITWLKSAVELGAKIIKNNKINIIYATAPPFTDFLIANELSKRFNIPFVVDYRDSWIDNAYYFYATPFHKLYSINLENDILIRAKKAFVTSRYIKELILKRYKFLSHEDIIIIPHGFDEEDFANYRNIKPDRNKFTITHSGLFPDDLTPKYYLKALANFLAKNKEANDVLESRFVGLMRNNHLRLIKKLKLEKNVKSTGYVSHFEAIQNLMESDVLWMMLPNIIATPGRFYEYIGSRKPLLISTPEGELRSTALQTKSAITTEAKDIKAIENAIDSLFSMWKHKGLPEIKEEFTKQFNRKDLTSILARELSLAADI